MATPPRLRKAKSISSPSFTISSSSASSTASTATLKFSYGNSKMNNSHPFGTQLADDLFDVHYYEEDCLEDAPDVYDYDSKNIPVKEEYEGEQFVLELETLNDIERRYRYEISRMRRGYNKMAHHALKWHYLMCDIEDNPQIKKMFEDMQLMRRLSGSENV